MTDGKLLLATLGKSPTSGGIYLSHTTPAPELSLEVSENALLSWIIPSLDFSLERSTDLLNWTNVTDNPVLNLTNLQNQVALPTTSENTKFRLLHQAFPPSFSSLLLK